MTAATRSTTKSCARSAGRPGTPSARAGYPRRSSGTRRTAPGGSRSSPASTAATTRSSTRSGSGPSRSRVDRQLMRRTVALAALLLLSLGVAAAATAPKPPAPVFVLAGGGWGHGVGMSQWGAYGQATAGRDYREILSTYYRGTAMGTAPDTLLKRVRVLVADGVNAPVANVAAVFDGAGKRYPIAGGTITAGSDLKLPVGKDDKPVALPGPV